MKHRSYKNTNLIAWIVIILGFSFLYFSYFFIYIPNQEAQLKQRAFRILKEYGSNMLDKHTYYKNHFNNYVLYYGIRHFGFQPVSKSEKQDSVEVQKVVNQLFEATTEFKISPKKQWPDTFQIDGNQIMLRFYNTIKKPNDGITENLINKDSLEALLKNGLLTSIPVNSFMQGLKFDRLFDNIVLLNDSQVFYNSNEDVLIDINNPVDLCDSIKGMQGGTYMKLDIRGEDKHIMILPIHFIGKEFFLAGFINDNNFRDITRTINNQLLIFLAGLLLLILIGMPILKVIFLSPNERLRSIDASSSVFSFILGTGLLILLTISFIKQQISDNMFQKNRIQQVSNSLYANFKSDLDSIKNLYTSINRLALERRKMADTTSIVFSGTDTTILGFVDCHFLGTNKALSDSGMKSHYTLYNERLNSNRRFIQESRMKNPFPLNEILLIDKSGIISKAVTSTPFSDLVPFDLSERKYFSNVIDPELSWFTKDSLMFYIESIQSYNTGAGETAVSFYTTAFGNETPVLAITSVIPSLYYQVVPGDVEFLIMNEAGKVLYHSIKSKNLHENFLEECESSYRLLKAVDLRVEDKFQLNYNGKKWIARIIPVEDTPLYHITLIDQIPVNNKNARIFLFSFYFFVISVFLLTVGIVIKKRVFPAKKELPFTWLLKWLDFKGENYRLYKKLIGLLVLAVLLQSAGVFFIKKPVAVLFYQFFFMVYVVYISTLVLKHREFRKKNYYTGLLFILLILLIQMVLAGQTERISIMVFLVVVFLITVYVTNVVLKNMKFDQKTVDSELKIQRIRYLLFLVLFLVNLSVMPVIQFYFSVKNTEERLWLQEQFIKVANDNLNLKTVFKNTGAPWFENIQGNEIDNLKILYEDKIEIPSGSHWLSNSDKIYLNLFDPITRSYYPGEFFKGYNYTNEWELGQSLLFSKAGKGGGVRVDSDGKTGFNALQLGFIILITSVVLIGFVWLLINYLASVIFNLYPEENPDADVGWDALLADPARNRILLKSFNGQYYFKHSSGLLQKKYINHKEKMEGSELKPFQVSQIFDEKSDFQDLLANQQVVWITGLDNYIYQIDKHESLLSFLMLVNQSDSKKVIVDFSSDVELIPEYYDEYIAENDIKPEQVAHLYTLRKRWGNIFRSYFVHNGYIDFNYSSDMKPDKNVGSLEIKIIKDICNAFKNDPQTWFNIIWESLSTKEKIVLYDLADDGLLNRKNKSIINGLIKKKLIVANSSLELFSSGFRDFVIKKLTPSKVQVLESRLGLKGQWKNIKYLVLLVLIPLAAFVFMSQGISMEKIFGIIGGALAAITGLLRLFDSSSFKQSASQ